MVDTRETKIRNFLLEPLFPGQKVTGNKGVYVKTSVTIKGFQKILNGECGNISEQSLFYIGKNEEAFLKDKEVKNEE